MTAKTRNRAAAAASALELGARNRQRLTFAAILGGAVLVVGLLAYLIWQETLPPPGEAVTVLTSPHIQVGQPHDPYNSDPPTSGPHYEQPAEPGFYSEAPADEALVHNLEHGYVIISYNCSKLSDAQCETLKAQIREVMSRAGVSSVTGTLKLIGAPRPTLATTLALTSWGRLEKLDQFNADQILRFIRAHQDNAPENSAQ
jgi:hypothetical protein